MKYLHSLKVPPHKYTYSLQREKNSFTGKDLADATSIKGSKLVSPALVIGQFEVSVT